MSQSFLYSINKDYFAAKIIPFDNAWLFSPMVWECLCNKYLPKIELLNGEFVTASFLGIDGVRNWNVINKIMNASEQQEIRIVWELSNQNFFCTKDKECVASAVENFLNIFPADDKGAQWKPHITNRFADIAKEIRSLNEDETPYFVFKNSSCDDSIMNLFQRDSDEEGSFESIPTSLKDTAKDTLQEFMIIQDGKIVKFISCKDFITKEE